MKKRVINKEKEIEYFLNWLSFKPDLSNKDIQNKNYKITDNDKTEYLISLKKYENLSKKQILKIKEILKEVVL